MATAKKRTKKTAAAPTAARKAPATKGAAAAKGSVARRRATAGTVTSARQSASKAASREKTTARKPASKAPATSKKAAATRPAPARTTTPLRGGGAKKASPARKTAPARKAAPRRAAGKAGPVPVDPEIFLPLTEGERAEALRVLLEDTRVASMASIGRYRVIATEPLAVKPPHGLAGHRLARVVIYDYASDRSVDACVDLDHGRAAFVNVSRAQPMLAREEEAAAISIALSDERVKEQLSLGEEPQVAMHYWSESSASLSFARRSAAVIFGRPDSSPSLIAVVDLLDNLVSEIVPATHW